MKRALVASLALISLVLPPPGVPAAGAGVRVAVLPLEVYGDQELSPLRTGLSDLVASELAADARVELARPAKVDAALGRLTGQRLDEATVGGLASELEAATAVWGSLTALGRSTSLVLKLTEAGERGGTRHFSAIAVTPDDVLPKLAALAAEARRALLGQAASLEAPASPAPLAPPASVSAAPEAAPAEAARAAPSPAPPEAGGVFPFRGSARWTSEDLPFAVSGMAVGDVDGDGRNEIVLIDPTTVRVYRFEGRRLVALAEAAGKGYENYIAVGLEAPAQGAGRRIVVTSMRDRPHSFLFEHREGGLVALEQDVPYFLRQVAGVQGTGLLGQEMSGSGWPFQGEIFQATVGEGGSYVRGEKADLPKGFALYHFSSGDLDGDGRPEYVAVDGEGRLLVYSASREFLGRGREGFGASCVGWQRAVRRGDADSSMQETVAIPPPLVAADLDGDGAQELLAVRNAAGGWASLLARKSADAQVEGLKWSDGRLVSAGAMEGIDGCVPAVAFEDVDGDGVAELLIASVTTSGTLLPTSHSSVEIYSKK